MLSKSEPVRPKELKVLDCCRRLSSKSSVCLSHTPSASLRVSFKHRTVCSLGFNLAGGKNPLVKP